MFSCPCPEVFTSSCKVILECLMHSSSHHVRPKCLVLQVQLSQNDHSPCCCPEVFSSPCHIILMCLVLTKTRSTTQQSKHTWCIQMGQTCTARKSTLLWRTIQHNDNLWFAVDWWKIKSSPHEHWNWNTHNCSVSHNYIPSSYQSHTVQLWSTVPPYSPRYVLHQRMYTPQSNVLECLQIYIYG